MNKLNLDFADFDLKYTDKSNYDFFVVDDDAYDDGYGVANIDELFKIKLFNYNKTKNKLKKQLLFDVDLF